MSETTACVCEGWLEGVADQIECDSGNCAFLQQPLPTVGETGN